MQVLAKVNKDCKVITALAWEERTWKRIEPLVRTLKDSWANLSVQERRKLKKPHRAVLTKLRDALIYYNHPKKQERKSKKQKE